MATLRRCIYVSFLAVLGCQHLVYVQKPQKQDSAPPAPVTSQEYPIMPYWSERKYMAKTRLQLQQENSLFESSGSLWDPNGNTSFLFAENPEKNVGDIVSLELDENLKQEIHHRIHLMLRLLEKAKALKNGDLSSVNSNDTQLPQVVGNGPDRSEKNDINELLKGPLNAEVMGVDGQKYKIHLQKKVLYSDHQFQIVLTGLLPKYVNSMPIKTDQLAKVDLEVYFLEPQQGEK